MAVSPRRTHTQTLLHLVRTGTRMDMDVSLLWDKMVLMGRIQHSINPTRSYMGSRRTPVLTGQVALLALRLAQEQWEFTTTRFSGLMSMMGMVESDGDFGLPSVAEGELGPTVTLFHLIPHDTMLLLPLVYYSCPLSASAHSHSC